MMDGEKNIPRMHLYEIRGETKQGKKAWIFAVAESPENAEKLVRDFDQIGEQLVDKVAVNPVSSSPESEARLVAWEIS